MGTSASNKQKNGIVTDILVSGYTRQAAEEYNIIIPEEIMRLCFVFFFIPICDEWCKELSYAGFHIDGGYAKLIDRSHESNTMGLVSLFGSRVIDKGIYEWKIKFKSMITWICIGIIVDDENALSLNKINNDYGFNKDEGCFLLNSNGKMYHSSSLYKEYAKQFQAKDTTITMTLDMDKHSIYYKVNDKDYGLGFNGLYKDKYRLAVTMSGQDDEIELL